jgi:uncharacterized membrane protein
MLTNVKKNWGVTVGLLVLGLVSVLFGALQLSLLGAGDVGKASDMASAHYFAMPVPIMVHIIAGTVFNLSMPFQFAPRVRLRWPKWHRAMGGVLVICGLCIGLSGLWMNNVYPSYGGLAKYTGIVTMSSLMIISMPLAVWFAIKGNISHHKSWMKVAVAAGLTPATQRVLFIPAMLIWGEEIMTDTVIGILIWTGLLINLSVLAWTERRKLKRA